MRQTLSRCISNRRNGGSKSFLNTASYDINGWGTSGGAEYKTKLGNFGLSLAYLHGNDNDNGTDNTVSSDQYEVAAYWRGDWRRYYAVPWGPYYIWGATARMLRGLAERLQP